jgi:uncharacterized protein YyaL (SSP411 family)
VPEPVSDSTPDSETDAEPKAKPDAKTKPKSRSRRKPKQESKPTAIPLLAGRPLVSGAPAAYVCRNFTCQAPVTTPSALRETLRRA